MTKAIVSDFSRVLLFPHDTTYQGGLNKLHSELSGRAADYNILDHFGLNQELLDFYRSLQGKYRLVIFTTGMVQNVPAIKKEIDALFEKVYAANELGWSKKDSKTYQMLAGLLSIQPEEIVYLDDNAGNIEAAAAAGCRAVKYESNAQAMRDIEHALGMDIKKS